MMWQEGCEGREGRASSQPRDLPHRHSPSSGTIFTDPGPPALKLRARSFMLYLSRRQRRSRGRGLVFLLLLISLKQIALQLTVDARARPTETAQRRHRLPKGAVGAPGALVAKCKKPVPPRLISKILPLDPQAGRADCPWWPKRRAELPTTVGRSRNSCS